MKPLTHLIVSILVLAFCLPARADFPISQAVGLEENPAVVYNSVNRQYLVVWNEWVKISDTVMMLGPVKGQRIGEHGGLLGSAFTIFSLAAYPSVTYNPQANEYLVVASVMLAGIQCQRISGSGSFVGSATTVIADSGSPQVLYNSLAGNYLVAGAKLTENPSGSGYYDISVTTRQVNAVGQPFAAPNIVDLIPHGYQPAEPRYSITYAPIYSTETPQGRYLLAIDATLSMLNSIGVAMCIVQDPAHPPNCYQHIEFKTGSPLGGVYYVHVSYGTQSGYSMTGPAFFLVWGDSNNNWSGSEFWPGIWGGFVSATKINYLTTDTYSDGSFPISYCLHQGTDANAGSWKPVAAFSPISEKYMIAWRETPDNSPWNDTTVEHIRGNTAFNSAPPSSNVIISAAKGNENPFNPAIAASSSEALALVVWEDSRNHSSSNRDIYGKIYNREYNYLPLLRR